jgi:hypothetical protein
MLTATSLKRWSNNHDSALLQVASYASNINGLVPDFKGAFGWGECSEDDT